MTGTDTRLVTARDVERAARRIEATCPRTPVLPLGRPYGDTHLWVKAECLQPTGSFKVRGASNAIAALEARGGTSGVVTFSAGNHGQALAQAAARAGIAATVVMPDTASGLKIDQTTSQGATVVVCPPDEIVDRAHALASEHDLDVVHPFDDDAVIAGQGTVGLELLSQLEFDTVLVPVGGGGLIAGVAAVVKGHRPAATIIGVEPEFAADLAEGFATGQRTRWTREQTRRTIADGLRSPTVGELPWRHIQELVDDVVTVGERSIASAMRWIGADAKLVVEPSGAVGVAAAVEHPGLCDTGTTVAIASGGNVEIESFAAYLS